jgi:4-alpha-glucanotransferase
MNLPASTAGNWAWRLRDGALTAEIRERLRKLTELYGRSAVDTKAEAQP